MKGRTIKTIRVSGLHPIGVRRLMDDVLLGSILGDVSVLTVQTYYRICEEWKGYSRGLSFALKVFIGMTCEYSISEMARGLKTTPQRVEQIQIRLLKMPALKRMRRRLRELQRDG